MLIMEQSERNKKEKMKTGLREKKDNDWVATEAWRKKNWGEEKKKATSVEISGSILCHIINYMVKRNIYRGGSGDC